MTSTDDGIAIALPLSAPSISVLFDISGYNPGVAQLR